MTEGPSGRTDWRSVGLRAAGLTALTALQLGWMRQPVPVTLELFQVALVGLTAWRPAYGLMVLAGVAPLTTTIWTALGSTMPGPLLLEPEDISLTGATGPPLVVIWSTGTALLDQFVLAVLTGALLRGRSGAGPSRVALPAAAFAAIALASAAALLPARLFADAPDGPWWRFFSAIWSGAYASMPQSGQPLAPFFYACLIAEGVALAWVAERTTRAQPALVRRLVAVAVLAGAVAALLNAQAIGRLAAGGADWADSLVQLLATRRASLQFDKNAAGSVFVLVIVAGIMLARRPVWRVLLVSVLIAAMAAGLWLTGSRAALLSLVVTLLGTILLMALMTRRARRALALAGTAIVVVSALLVAFYPRTRNYTVSGTVTTRLAVVKAAARMTMSAPVFGVGVGTFIERSGDFGTGALDPSRLTTAHENAHNNFLQVLAEAGLVGLVAFLALIAAVVVPAVRGAGTSPDRRWLLAGVSGFMLTWWLGHPLLVPEAAFTFWLFFGMLAGLTPAPALLTRRALLTWLAAALIVSVPFRAAHQFTVADFRHVGVNLSQWERRPEETAFRAAGRAFALYVATNTLVTVPLRRAPGAPSPLRVEYRVDGRLVDVIVIRSESWQLLTLHQQSKHARFVRVDFTAMTDDGRPIPNGSLQVGEDRMR